MLKILLLMSDTGGGHRASSEALKDAFELFYEGSVCLETVDLWTEHGSFPVNQMVPSYRVMMNNPWLWFATYHSVPNKRALRLFTDTLYLMNHQYVKEYLLEEEPDVVISVHPLCNHVPLRILRELEINEWKHRKVTPFYTVVTDLGVCHITWFARGANRIFVASETTQQFALTHDIPPNNISVVGLPLRRAFWAPFVDNRESLCKRLNLNPRIPVVVVMSGGEGGGGDLADIFASILRTLYAWRTKTCCLLRDACYHDFDRRHEFTSLMEFFLQRRLVQVVVICGKNVHALKQIENINDDIPMGLLTSLKGKVVDTEAQRGKPSSHLDVEETHPDGESDDDTSAKRGDKSSGLNRLMGNLFFNNGDRLLTARQDIYSFVRMLARPDGTGCSSFKISPVGTLHALGFVSNVEDYMHAASVLITKAGPGTIAEAACCRLPCILSSFLPGQEEGNVEYVRNSGIGDYAPTAKTVATQLVHMLYNSLGARVNDWIDRPAEHTSLLPLAAEGRLISPSDLRSKTLLRLKTATAKVANHHAAHLVALTVGRDLGLHVCPAAEGFYRQLESQIPPPITSNKVISETSKGVVLKTEARVPPTDHKDVEEVYVSTALDFNQATLSGCIDIIVVQQEDATLKSTPFHVRFGRMQLLRSRNKVVQIFVNDVKSALTMHLGVAGEAFFLVPANHQSDRDWVEESNDAGEGEGTPEEILSADEDESLSQAPLNSEETAHGFASVEASLCGHILSGKPENVSQDAEVFDANKVTFNMMDSKASLWFHPSLVFRFHGGQPYYPARVALPLLASWTVFGRGLGLDAMMDLMRTQLDSRVMDVSPFESPAPRQKPDMTEYGVLSEGVATQRNSMPVSCCEVDGSVDGDATISERFKRTLRPTSDELKLLNLQPGYNEIKFFCESGLQGSATVKGSIYLWDYNSKVVVSDVDGTITRSDVWGQLMPIVGRDWSHSGVAEFFQRIHKNGYKILYLTARAIGQADSTRDYLFGLTQSNTVKLPDGPLILSPDRLFRSFKREVIDRKPYVFKIAALRDIRSLFQHQSNPFYAGFGNRDTDHKAYTHIGIPEAKVFIINHEGVVHHVNTAYAKTYESMSTIAESIFPPRSTLEDDEEVSTTCRDRKRFNAARIYKMGTKRGYNGGAGLRGQGRERRGGLFASLRLKAFGNQPTSAPASLADSRTRRRSSLGDTLVTPQGGPVAPPPACPTSIRTPLES